MFFMGFSLCFSGEFVLLFKIFWPYLSAFWGLCLLFFSRLLNKSKFALSVF